MQQTLVANPYKNHPQSNHKLDILMSLVVATFIIVGVYMGYHISQNIDESTAAHNIEIWPDTSSMPNLHAIEALQQQPLHRPLHPLPVSV